MGELDNTLIIYIDGDNGASAEGTCSRHAQPVHHVQRRFRAGQRPVPLVSVLGIGTDGAAA